MKKILLVSLFVGASFVNMLKAEEIDATLDGVTVSDAKEQTSQSSSATTEQAAPTFVKQENVLLINRSQFPVIFAVYDTITANAMRQPEHIENGQVALMTRDFFANQMQQLLTSDTNKLAIGCSYGVEKIGPNSSAFMPEWKGIVLETQDLVFLSLLFNEVNVVELSMIFIGQLPILCINAPEAKMSFSVPCNEIKQAFGQNYPLFQACLGTKEFTQSLWGNSAENNPSYDQMIVFLQQVITENIQAQQAAIAQNAVQPEQENTSDVSEEDQKNTEVAQA